VTPRAAPNAPTPPQPPGRHPPAAPEIDPGGHEVSGHPSTTEATAKHDTKPARRTITDTPCKPSSAIAPRCGFPPPKRKRSPDGSPHPHFEGCPSRLREGPGDGGGLGVTPLSALPIGRRPRPGERVRSTRRAEQVGRSVTDDIDATHRAGAVRVIDARIGADVVPASRSAAHAISNALAAARVVFRRGRRVVRATTTNDRRIPVCQACLTGRCPRPADVG